jgi:hypothetical protein
MQQPQQTAPAVALAPRAPLLSGDRQGDDRMPLKGSSAMNPDDMARLTKTAEKLLEQFPAIFTLFSVGVFIMPLWMMIHIGWDENVRQWITRQLWVLTIILPCTYGAVHFLHVIKRVPNRLAIIVALYGSAVTFILVGNFVLVSCYRHGNAFLAEDCYASREKQQLQVQYESAVQFYVDCAVTISQNETRNVTFGQAVTNYRITDCPGYAEQAAMQENQAWDYLAFMEDTYHCSGWCKPMPAMWVHTATTDTCPGVVAQVMFQKVKWTMEQVVLYNIVVLSFIAIVPIRVGDVFKGYGVVW